MMESEQERSRFRERKPKNKINHVFNRKAALHRFDIDAPDDWEPKQGSEPINIKEEEEEVETSLEGEQLKMTPVPLKSEDGEEEPLISQIHRHQMKGRDLPIISSADEESCRGAETTWHPGLNTHEDGPSSPETEDIHEDAWDNDVLPADVLQVVVVKEEVPEDWRPDVNQQELEPLNITEEEEEQWTSLKEHQLSGMKKPDATRVSFNIVTLKSEDEEEPLISQINQHQMEGRGLSVSSSAEQMEVEADEDDCDSPNLNTEDGYSSEAEASEDDEEVEDGNNPHMQLKLLSEPGSKTEDAIHTGPKSFCYDPCDESSQNMNFNAQMTVQEGQKVFVCDVCRHSFSQKSRLNRHMIIHTGQKPFCCDVCQQSFTRKTNLNIHMRIHTGQKPYSCDVCSRSFSQKISLNMHMRIHTGQKPFCCDVCGQQFRNKGYINSHMRIHTGQKPYCCDVCGRNFSQKTSLKIHTRIHTGQKPFSCDVCGRSFSQKIHLNTHMRSHTGQKPFGCDVCGQRFTRKTSLNTHMRIHTGQKPFSCDVCGQSFNQKPHLTTHMRIHTKGETSRKLLETA
nr:zinc finger protein 436 isoform X10 [Nothobranchius furzeri]